MLTLGLVGGVAYVSTIHYYRVINELIAKELGGLHSSRLVLSSLDLADYARLAHTGQFQSLSELVAGAAEEVCSAGAACIVLCSNTAHIAAAALESNPGMPPLLHIADACSKAIVAEGKRKIGFLGTRFTMAEPFLLQRFERHGLVMIAPSSEEQMSSIQALIENELSVGIFTEQSRADLVEEVRKLAELGAEAVVLGCTELPLLLKQDQLPASLRHVTLFDCSFIHCLAAVEVQLGKQKVDDFLPPL